MPVLWPVFRQHEAAPATPNGCFAWAGEDLRSRHVVRARGCALLMISATKATLMWFTQSGGTNEGEALAPAIAKGAIAVLHPPGTARLAWRSIRWKLLASVLLCLSPWSSVFAQIRAIQEGGRTVFVNDDTVASDPPAMLRTAIGLPTNTGATRSGAGSLCHRHPRVCCGVHEMQPPKCRPLQRQLPRQKLRSRRLWRLVRTRSAKR